MLLSSFRGRLEHPRPPGARHVADPSGQRDVHARPERGGRRHGRVGVQAVQGARVLAHRRLQVDMGMIMTADLVLHLYSEEKIILC